MIPGPGALMKCECSHCTCGSDLKLAHSPIRFIGEEIQGDPNWNVRVRTLEGVINVCARCWKEHYQRSAPVPDKIKVEWVHRNICPNCGVENLYPSGKFGHSESGGTSSTVREFGTCDNCGMGHAFAGVSEKVFFSDHADANVV